MEPDDKKKCISHVRHCVEYKRIILLKVLHPIGLPLVIDKHIFTYIGFFPIVFGCTGAAHDNANNWKRRRTQKSVVPLVLREAEN